MGIHDRDYVRSSPRGNGAFSAFAHTALGTIVLINVICWLAQEMTQETIWVQPTFDSPVEHYEHRAPVTDDSPVGHYEHRAPVTDFLVCKPSHIFDGFPQIWRLVTCTFAHGDMSHILWNMLFLYFLGREIERMYGRRDFWLLYLGSGALASLVEICIHRSQGSDVGIIGASGSVTAVVVLCALFFPHRQILFMLFIPMPLWLLCIIMIGKDVLAAFGPADGVAHLAHLTGALCGFLYWRFDLRWATFWAPLLRLKPGPRRKHGGTANRAARPAETARTTATTRAKKRPQKQVPGPISKRMDSLLEKISEHGMGSLTDEEREFMVDNARRYRSS